MAVIINGEGVPEDFYQAEIKRYLAVQPEAENNATPSPESQVLDELIYQVLLAQAAEDNGFEMDDSGLQARIQNLQDQLGGEAPFQEWLNANSYTLDQFKYALRISSAASWMRDRITKDIPTIGEQVHLRQILFSEEANAQSALQEVRSGADFATLAEQYDPITRGDIGWFPRGYLTQAVVEEAAFKLQPGEVSEVIKSEIGFHLIQVIERDANHPYSPDAYQAVQKQALSLWLAEQKASSQIEIRSQ